MDAQTFIDIGSSGAEDGVWIPVFLRVTTAIVFALPVWDYDVFIRYFACSVTSAFVSSTPESAATINGTAGWRQQVLCGAVQFMPVTNCRIPISAGRQLWVSSDANQSVFVLMSHPRQT